MKKNIILQHFDGELRELDLLSIKNIQSYANRIGAEYELIRGKPFNPELTAPCQKLQMLSTNYDQYDQVLMLDIDMFTVKNLSLNIFEQPGIGLHEETQTKLHNRLIKTFPSISSKDSPYWGGAIYKLNKDIRIKLRKQLVTSHIWIKNYNKLYFFEDEGIMHSLATLAKIKIDKNSYLNPKWCQGSFYLYPEQAYIIHIRTKMSLFGPKQEKIKNYLTLKNAGVIE